MTTRSETTIERTEQAAEQSSSAARLFDIRRIIGGLFLLYGLVLLVAGLVDGAEASEQAAGIDINVWTGLGMALTGAFFLTWMWRRPLAAQAPPPEDQHVERS
jgi:hypothetical protein